MVDIEIPEGLGTLLRDFTLSVLSEKPKSLVDFAADYFRGLQNKSPEHPVDKPEVKTQAPQATKPQPQNAPVTSKSKVPMYIIVDDDEAGEPDKDTFKPKNPTKSKYARRGSVSAERFDPEAEASGDEPVVHQKTEAQSSRLTDAIKNILIFRSLDSGQLHNVVDAMFEKKVSSNEIIIKQGDDGDNFYVIDRGRFGVIVGTGAEKKRVHQFENSGSFGELALMYNMPRSATIVAESEGVLWAMDRKSFRQIVLTAAFKKRKLYEQLLREVPILASLNEMELTNLADALLSREYKNGDSIIKEGDEADGMYFIENGSLKVTVTKGGVETEVVRLNKGKYFGEVALIEDKPRTASVYAVTDVKLAFLERESFERLLGPCLDIMKRKTTGYNNKGK